MNMHHGRLISWTILWAGAVLGLAGSALAGQAPDSLASPDIPISRHDRVYTAEQFSNTVSVTNPVSAELLGVIRLGASQPGNF